MNKLIKALLIFAVFEAGVLIGMYMVLRNPIPVWGCNAEDEVVVIDGSCRHVDTL